MIFKKLNSSKPFLYLFLIFFVSIFSKCKKDEISDPSIASSDQKLLKNSLHSGELLAATVAPSGAYNIQNALPSGFVKDGSKDYTIYIQQAIDKYSEIAFPGFPILINDLGLKIGSNKRLTFLNGSEIRLKPSSKSTYNILDIREATNVTLIDVVVVGDKNKHLATGGEAGVGIGIRGSSNITLINPKVSNCWGDGIYMGISNNAGCKNVIINGGSASYNRRDGISIISVDGFKLDNFYAGHNFGTTPECGINFEPNSKTDELKNIVFNNVTTEGNLGYGIMMGLSNLYGGPNKFVDVTINNHIDKQSKKAMKMSCYPTKRLGSEVITANVVYNNPSWKQHPLTNDIIAVALFETSQKLVFKNPFVQTASGINLTKLEITNTLTRLFNKGSNVSLIFLNELLASSVVVAINSGGSEFTASNGIKYLSDRYFTGGNVYSSSSSISGTTDDVLYQKERYGNFSYSIPVSNGIYEVTLKLAETVYSSVSQRRFDVLFEGTEQISNLDLFAFAGKNNAHDIVKTINVNDGKLDMQFKTDINYAQLNAFHIIKK
ncbi:malectin domain-containing carbohydrate-binding protein [Daejeonella oryzae]|uniref:malectin domain-containing carbohydrate-binding protein n=1 Tax=Daejeonella oryzae TaxID=1122943 RepID=UPI000414D8F9|nr:malectin domain-containing carbohydrate-binding protein [Daejeonella oryzae]